MNKKNLDFRSDTVTLPTPEMRKAATNCPLGDDVVREDPTVNKLEKIGAEMLGKEAGLFVTSGTQGNAVAVLSHTKRGDEIILESRSHIYLNEVGGLAVLGSLMARTIQGQLGWLRPEDIKAAVRRPNIHYPETTLVCIENTHNAAGGIPITPEQLKADWEVSKENNLGVHMDGARIFNAAIALDLDVKDLTQYSDTVQICLSKGLSAPVGSLVVGTEELVTKARKYRKMLGGGMRQAGIIAAPGIIALTKMVDRLSEDHENAKILADGLREINGIRIINPVLTNMVYIDISELGWTGDQWIATCSKLGWKSRGGKIIRLCTHYGIEKEDIEKFVEGLRKRV